MAYKTSPRHFEIFKKECLKWIEIFGLKDWECHFSHDTWDDCNRANLRANITGRIVSINLNPNWENMEINNHEVRKTAYHEICELLLVRLGWLARERTVAEAEVEEEAHAIIRRLENAFFE